MSRELFPGEYKSPSGNVVKFDYEDIESHFEMKASVFETAIGNGTYVQSNGRTSGRFPLRCFISGDNYEDKAEAFLSAVGEPGEGVLTHPIYGAIKVVVVGPIPRLDPLKSGRGQVVFDVQFFETTGLQLGETTDTNQIFDSLLDAGAVDFSENIQLTDPVDATSFKNRLDAALKTISSAIKKASGAVAKVNEAIEDAGDSAGRTLDTALGDPLSLARQCQLLIGQPRRELSMVTAKAAAYQNLAKNIFKGTLAEPSKYSKELANSFHMNKMLAQSMVGNTAMLALASAEYKTKDDYIRAAERLTAFLDEYQTWHDDNFKNLEVSEISQANTDTGDGVAELYQLFSATCSDLITRSLRTKEERIEPLTSDRNPIELCYQLTGTATNDALDDFANLNELAGDEFFLIPQGREIVWHV